MWKELLCFINRKIKKSFSEKKMEKLKKTLVRFFHRPNFEGAPKIIKGAPTALYPPSMWVIKLYGPKIIWPPKLFPPFTLGGEETMISLNFFFSSCTFYLKQGSCAFFVQQKYKIILIFNIHKFYFHHS